MRNRPLLSVCLIILCVLASCTLVGKERFIKELRPSPLEICTTEDESVIVCGVIYRQEQKENGQMIYLKHNSVYSISNKQKFQESKIIVYINSREKLHIGNRIKVRGTVSFYENARNPGNFDQKFYYQKQGIHGKIYGSQMQITDKSVDVFRTGCLPFIPAVDRFVQSRRTGRRNAVISVCFNDRDDSLGTKGMGNVPVPGRCGCYREKIRYADGTFCSSSNRSWK